MKVTIKHVSDMKVLRSRGVKTAPPGHDMTCTIERVMPKTIRLKDAKYGQVCVTLDRKTGVEVGGWIVGYRLSKRDLKAVERHISQGLHLVYVQWMDSIYAMEVKRAFDMVLKIRHTWDSHDNLGVNFKDYGTRVESAPKGAVLFDAGTSFQSKAFWDRAHSKLLKIV